MVSPPSLQIYLQFRVTLTFKLLTRKLTVSCPCPIDHLCQLASKPVVVTICEIVETVYVYETSSAGTLSRL